MAGLAFSCDKVDFKETAVDDSSLENPGVQPSVEQITISAYLPEDGVMKGGTKVAITEAGDYSKAELAWEAGDQITIVSTGTPVTATLGISSIDGKKAEFSGPAPVGTAPYTIFYHRSKPLTIEKFDSITCDGQVQDGNGSTSHLQYGMKLEGVNAYQSLTFSQEWAAANSEGGTGTITQNSVLQMILKLPDGVGEVYSIYVHDDGAFKQTLWLTDGANLFATPTAGHIIKAYMMVPDMDLASGNLTVRVETEDGAYEAAYPLNTTDWTGGAQYTVQKNMSGLSAVTGEHAAMEIHAKSAQDILQFKEGVAADNARFKASNVVLESDIDMSSAGTWSASIPDTFKGTFGSASALEKKRISGISATAPLFVGIPSGATMKDFELTGSFTFVQSAADYLGALAKTAQGTISGVTVGASISVNCNKAINGLVDFGGLVGRVNNLSASIDDCCFNGSITVLSTYSNTNANGIRLGGLVGYVTKQITISDSSFEGVIRCEGAVSAEATDPTDAEKHPALSIGGIVGKLQKGIISDCTTTDADDALKPGITVNKTDYKGSIFVKSSTYNSVAIGGIAGFCYDDSASITGCSNACSILTNVTTENADSVYLFSGGIVGLNRENVTDCSNTGTQQHFSTSRWQSIGGLIGRHHGTLTVSSGVKNIGGSISVDYSPSIGKYQLTTGGLIGYSTVAINGISSANFSNSGIIQVNHSGVKCTPTAGNDYGLFLGGIVGYATADVKNASNSGNVTFVCKNAGSAEVEGGSQYVYLGGIVGKVIGSSYSARVDVEYCSNSGVLTHNPTSTAPNSATCFYQYNYLGGIAGYAEFVNIKGDASNKTTNSGSITGGCTPNESSYHDNTFFIGGIVGYMNGRNSSVDYCDLTGSANIYNNHWTNRAVGTTCPMCGGIAGVIYGTSSNHATISNCSVASTTTVNGRRGVVGGIVGWCRGGTVTNCIVNNNLSTSSYGVGGIAGRTDYGDITSCTFNGTSITSSQAQKMGGIVAIIGNASCTIDGCNSYVTTISTTTNASGAIAGTSVANSIIKSCHYKSGMSICGDAIFTAGEGLEANADDL